MSGIRWIGEVEDKRYLTSLSIEVCLLRLRVSIDQNRQCRQGVRRRSVLRRFVVRGCNVHAYPCTLSTIGRWHLELIRDSKSLVHYLSKTLVFLSYYSCSVIHTWIANSSNRYFILWSRIKGGSNFWPHPSVPIWIMWINTNISRRWAAPCQ